jgi:hypothetical protein
MTPCAPEFSPARGRFFLAYPCLQFFRVGTINASRHLSPFV